MKNKKYLWLIGVLLLIIVGLVGFLIGREYWGGPAAQTQIRALDNPKDEHILANVRNTPIVQAVKLVGPAVVGITTRVYDRDIFDRRVLVGESVGSGVIFDEKGYIVTNYHVVGESREVNVLLASGETVAGKVVGGDAATDLAVVKVAAQGLPVAEFGDSDSLVVGEPAVAIGNPLGLELRGTVTVGVISAVNRIVNPLEQRFPMLQTDAAINQGNSGGALVNAEGKVVGINSIKIANTGVEGLGFAIPINSARPILKELIEHGKVRRAYLGLWAVDRTIAARYGYEWAAGEEGILVMRVDPRGPLAGTEIGPQCFITAIDGEKVATLADLRARLDAHAVGDEVRLTYRHSSREETVTVRLAEAQ